MWRGKKKIPKKERGEKEKHGVTPYRVAIPRLYKVPAHVPMCVWQAMLPSNACKFGATPY